MWYFIGYLNYLDYDYYGLLIGECLFYFCCFLYCFGLKWVGKNFFIMNLMFGALNFFCFGYVFDLPRLFDLLCYRLILYEYDGLFDYLVMVLDFYINFLTFFVFYIICNFMMVCAMVGLYFFFLLLNNLYFIWWGLLCLFVWILYFNNVLVCLCWNVGILFELIEFCLFFIYLFYILFIDNIMNFDVVNCLYNYIILLLFNGIVILGFVVIYIFFYLFFIIFFCYLFILMLCLRMIYIFCFYLYNINFGCLVISLWVF